MVFTGSLAVGISVFGLTSKVVVTPTQVVVCTPFTARRVPRSRLRGCELRSEGDLALLVEGGPPVTVGTGTGPWWMEYANRRPAQLRAAKRLQALLDVIPAEPGDGPLTARRRYPVIALAALAAVAAVGSAAAVLT